MIAPELCMIMISVIIACSKIMKRIIYSCMFELGLGDSEILHYDITNKSIVIIANIALEYLNSA